MRLKALQSYTAKLPLVEPSNPLDLLGINTKEAILSGVVMGMTQELQGTIDAYKKRYSKIIVILTGGDAPFFDKKLKSGIFADADLLLKGMNFILTHNADNKS
jgi:type III pantothenate kinase